MIKIKEKNGKKVNLPCMKSVSIGRAYDLLRADVQEHLTKAHNEIGFEYCRFHAVFHDDMDIVRLTDEGEIVYRWHHIDKIYDFLLSIGMKPFIELNPMPSVIASGDKTMFWYEMNITPPSRMELWYDLIYNFTKHLAIRYGNDEVSTWFFEVWNEPNLECFWTGTKEEYFDLYKNAVQAVKAVDENFKVGGPATATAGWIEDTIDFCFDNNVPIDFVSTHAYPQDEYCIYKTRDNSPHELGRYYIDTVKGVHQTVKNSKMPDLKIYWTEFNTLSCDCEENIKFLSNTALDRLYSASCIVRNMIEVKDYCDIISYWVVSDIFEEGKMPHLPFSGTYGLLNINGIKKAAYNAFVLMKKMRGSILHTEADIPQGCGIMAAEENGIYKILLWNNKLPEIKEQPVWSDMIKLPTENDEEYIVERAVIKEGKGSPYETWLKLGKPSNPTPFEQEILRGASEPEYLIERIEAGKGIEFSLASDEVSYIEIKKADDELVVKRENQELNQLLRTH